MIGGGRRRGAEPSMVPRAEFRSYYGRPVIKRPTWKSPDVPVYLFLGGLAGASSMIGALAGVSGRPRLASAGYVTAALGAAGGTVALIHDLGRPARFLNMLRVIRPTSPLSTGSWLLASFASASAVAAATTVSGRLPGAGRVAGAAAALLGAPMMTYTAVLLADTAVPAWHEAHRELPFLFAGGALASGGGAGLLAVSPAQAGPARHVAAAGVALEFVAERRMTSRLGLVAEPYHRGRAGRWLRVARVLSAAGGLGALVGRRSRVGSAVAGVALLTGALCSRFAVFEAGRASADDPKYTVVPQRERLARAGHSGGAPDRSR